MKTKKCKICFSDIPTGAKKCIHCNSYQNWRRKLDFSNSILALVIALLSVSGIVIPEIKKTFEKDLSNVNAESYVITEDGISLICLNSGNKPGYISNCKIEIKDSKSTNALWDFNLDLRLPSTSRVVIKENLDEKFYSIKKEYFKEQINNYTTNFKLGLDDDNFIFL